MTVTPDALRCPSCTTDTTLLRLSASKVWAEEHVLIMGEIRNACRDGYSHDRQEISQDAQRRWWAANFGQLHAWLVYDTLDNRDRLVGYGLLRPIGPGEEGLTTSVGVFPSARGYYFGRGIMRFLVHYAQGCLDVARVWSTASIANPAAIGLHDPAHWIEVPSPEPARLRAFTALRWPP